MKIELICKNIQNDFLDFKNFVSTFEKKINITSEDNCMELEINTIDDFYEIIQDAINESKESLEVIVTVLEYDDISAVVLKPYYNKQSVFDDEKYNKLLEDNRACFQSEKEYTIGITKKIV